MAFGFIKKVFSFGRKEEPAVADPAPAPLAIDTIDAPAAEERGPLPDFLRREQPQQASDANALTESPPDIAAIRVESDRPAFDLPPAQEEERAVGDLAALPPATLEEFDLEAEEEPRTVPPEPGELEKPAPPEVAPEPTAPAALPSAEMAPPIRVPSPIETRPVEAEIAPEPAAIAAPEPVARPETTPEPAPRPRLVAPPSAEIAPPIRQPFPVETRPVEAEIAPEPQAIEPPSPATEAPAIIEQAPPVGTPAPRPSLPAAGKVLVGKVIAPKIEQVEPVRPAERTSWFQRLRDGLSRSSRELTGGIAGIFTKRKLNEETLEELEEVLLRADLGMETAIRVTDALSASRYGKDVSDTEVRQIMAQEVEKVLRPVALPLELDLSHKPHVILVVGVNGTGKTTTIGKLAAKLTAGGLSVMLAAGDTFRAAAIEQLKIWGERTGSPVVSSKIGADAAGLAWDAFEKAKAAGSDVLIIDTAGRLQNRTELMAELEKIVRVLGKHDPEAPHTVLQTVDATTGQNALNQVEIFRNVAGVNGLVMTKLDGTARGGILVAIAAKHKLPVYFIGVGEQVDDLEPFSASDFAKAIAGVA